jgi:ATP-dependent Lon protease
MNRFKKAAGDSKEDSSSRKMPARNRRRGGAGGGNKDDDSVDSKGNIRNLIAYSVSDEEMETDSEDSDFIDEDSEPIVEQKKKKKSIAPKKVTKKKSKRVIEEEDEEDEEEEEEEEPVRRRIRKAVAKNTVKKSRKRKEEEYEEEEEEEEDEEDDEEYDEEDDEDYEDENEGHPGISILFGSGDDMSDRMIPKRHNMKKESADVKKFVKLVSKPLEYDTIDDQIDHFKGLAEDKQKQLLEALDRKPSTAEQNLMFKILTMKLPEDVQTMVLSKYHSLQTLDAGSGEFFKMRNWLEKLTSVPFGISKEIPVRIEDGTESCGAFMERARRCLEEAIYGQEESKLQIMQFIATKISNPKGRGLSLLLAGPPGIGKTSLIKNGIAKALGWPFQFISLGGDSDATTYTGHQLVYEGSHSGKIVNSLITAKSMSMVLMFDELDKISTTAKGEEVQNMLIHLTDPVQNEGFEDKYLAGVPIDLSQVMFVFSANDLSKIDRVLLDRMMVIQLQGYNQKEKLAIAENFLVPAALRDVNLGEKVAISKEVLEHMMKEYANEETGVRELKRCVEQIAQKINMLRIFNSKDLPFYIKDFQLPFVVKKEHIDLFLKKKPGVNESFQRMYL